MKQLSKAAREFKPSEEKTAIKLRILRAALSFYANENLYPATITEDRGWVARHALGETR